MTAPTMPAVLREAAEHLPAPTLAGALAAIHTVADPAGRPFADAIADLFAAHEAEDGWPQFRTLDGWAAYLFTAAADLEVELARELEHARRRHPVTECQSCGRRASSVLCDACTQGVVDDSHLVNTAIHTPGSAR